jgi:hypothetical protein
MLYPGMSGLWLSKIVIDYEIDRFDIDHRLDTNKR